MKKLAAFLRSMKFGMLLLILICVCLVIGSLVPQQSTESQYIDEYGESTAKLLGNLSFTDIFHSWYFYLLEGLLCLNLILCSILRFADIRKRKRMLTLRAEEALGETAYAGEGRGALEEYLKVHFFRRRETRGAVLYEKGKAGFYGSFLTHLSILMILVFGSLVLLTPQVKDYTVMPGETLTLEDGITLRCDSFRIMDDTGKLDYASTLHIQDEKGNGKDQVVRVNEPLRFGHYKIYQQTYGTAGHITFTNKDNGASEESYLTDKVRLFLDEKNGIQFNALYPGYIVDEDGNYTLITSSSTRYEDPVYDILTVIDGVYTPVLAFPGDEITIGNVTFRFSEPVEYPGLRVKKISPLLYAGLYVGFALMIAALYCCFFSIPVFVTLRQEGFAAFSLKSTAPLLREIETRFGEKKASEEAEKSEENLEI